MPLSGSQIAGFGALGFGGVARTITSKASVCVISQPAWKSGAWESGSWKEYSWCGETASGTVNVNLVIGIQSGRGYRLI